MKKAILVGLALLTISTSAASAWTDRNDESRAMKPHASARVLNANAAMAPSGAPNNLADKQHPREPVRRLGR